MRDGLQLPEPTSVESPTEIFSRVVYACLRVNRAYVWVQPFFVLRRLVRVNNCIEVTLLWYSWDSLPSKSEPR